MICSAVDEAWNSSEWIFFIESLTDQHLLSITYHSTICLNNAYFQHLPSAADGLLGGERRKICKSKVNFRSQITYLCFVKANNEFTHLRLAFLGREKALWPLFTLGFVGAGFTLWYIKR